MERDVHIATKDEDTLFYEVPPFQVKKRPLIEDKVVRWLGLKVLDIGQQHYAKRLRKAYLWLTVYLYIILTGIVAVSIITGSPNIFVLGIVLVFGFYKQWKWRKKRDEEMNSMRVSNTKIMYRYCIRYWNMKLKYIMPYFYFKGEANVSKEFLHYGFESDHTLKLERIPQFSNVPNDTISYIKYKKGLDIEKTNKVGLHLRLVLPNRLAKRLGPFLLVPAGNKVKMKKYKLQEVLDTHDVYAKKELPKKRLHEILSFLQPLLDRNIHVAVKYNREMEIYIPDLLTHVDPIISEEQIEQISDKINFWYDFYERSLIWRYGQIPAEWTEGEKEALVH
ncbi:hypothetical protein [Oceanobacillus manasiensis]|uniref:hypothetical protein n=1 Tax=Oceanobacillus manasiensis TaxID=586413 RepID=UPI0005AA47E7|nr:hypothetical protein [Oceanobacillus manasiensis]